MDKMIAMVEGAQRKKTPNEIALQIFLVALSIIFILVTVSLYTYSVFSANQAGIPNPTSVTTLVALLVCLAPTTIGALLSAIGIAGMSRLNQANVLALSGRAIEAAGDVDILTLDKMCIRDRHCENGKPVSLRQSPRRMRITAPPPLFCFAHRGCLSLPGSRRQAKPGRHCRTSLTYRAKRR